MAQCKQPDCGQEALLGADYCMLHAPPGTRRSKLAELVRPLTPTGGFGSIYGYIKDDKGSRARSWAFPAIVVAAMVIAYFVLV